jgi:hypothetical protein
LARGRRCADPAVDRLQPARVRQQVRPGVRESPSRELQPRGSRLQRHRGTDDGHVDDQAQPQRIADQLRDRLWAARQAGLQVPAAVRSLLVPGDRVERERFREPDDARPARRSRVRRRSRRRGRVGPSTAASTTSRRRSIACRARRSRSARPASGG